MDISQNLEEALALLWYLKEKDETSIENYKRILTEEVDEDTFDTFLKNKYIKIQNNNVEFEIDGENIARDITRRHRLTERLLIDIIDVGADLVHPQACKLEHVLSNEVTDAICTLLGHPKECPHGALITPGKCCKENKETLQPLIQPLKNFSPGDILKISYIFSKDISILQKLTEFGVHPGAVIEIEKNYPSFVLKINSTTIAIEQELSNIIFGKRI